MSWLKRRGLKYYYRSVRRGDRISNVYLGRGHAAELAAQVDALRRAERQREAQELGQLKQQLEPAQMTIKELSKMVELMTRSALLVAGWRQHVRSAWRKQRGQTRSQRSVHPAQQQRIQAAG